MASIHQRGKSYKVIYTYYDYDHKKHQKWETYKTYEEALARKIELDALMERRKKGIRKCNTLDELLDEYVEIYGRNKWSLSVYAGNTRMIANYISPVLGKEKLKSINVHSLEKYYSSLLVTQSAANNCPGAKRDEVKFVTPHMVKKIHQLLHSAFEQAVKWEILEKNPAAYATIPPVETKQRPIWDDKTFFAAVRACDNDTLRLCMHLSFACSLRLGEILGLTWDCVDISDQSIAEKKASIYVTKTLQRVQKSAIEFLNKKDVIRIFPERVNHGKTILVLKKPKTKTSVRRVFLPTTVAKMLIDWKLKQEEIIRAIGDEYSDYDLVVPRPAGTPMDIVTIDQAFADLIKKNDLPSVVFHSLRHTSITYKLKLNGGDIKSVQGDSGHAQASMVTEQYSHIMDESRVTNAHLIEKAFYQESDERDNTVTDSKTDGANTDEIIRKLLDNPELLNILRNFIDKQ